MRAEKQLSWGGGTYMVTPECPYCFNYNGLHESVAGVYWVGTKDNFVSGVVVLLK